jgi:hypothetical protein
MRDKGENRDLLLVLVACAVLFALNFVWLLWVRHSSPEVLRSLKNLAVVAQLKRLLLQPLSLFLIAAVWTSWIIVFLRSKMENRTHRLYIFALILSIPCGLFLFFVFVR